MPHCAGHGDTVQSSPVLSRSGQYNLIRLPADHRARGGGGGVGGAAANPLLETQLWPKGAQYENLCVCCRSGGRRRLPYCIFMGNMGTPSSESARPHRNVAPGLAGPSRARVQSRQLGLIYIINFEYFIVCLGKDTAGGRQSRLGRYPQSPNPNPALAVAGPLSLDSGDAA